MPRVRLAPSVSPEPHFLLAGFFFRNLRMLCRSFRVHAVDMLGTGLSGRPSWTATTREAAEDFFLSSLASWRERMGLGKVRPGCGGAAGPRAVERC